MKTTGVRPVALASSMSLMIAAGICCESCVMVPPRWRTREHEGGTEPADTSGVHPLSALERRGAGARGLASREISNIHRERGPGQARRVATTCDSQRGHDRDVDRASRSLHQE